MTRRTLTDAERIASIREVIEAARGDWHEATALLSVGADLHWLLKRAALPNREDAPELPDHPAMRQDHDTARWPHSESGMERSDATVYWCARCVLDTTANRLTATRSVREDAPSREGLDR